MYHAKFLALGALLTSLAVAAPLDKRDLVIVTAYDIVTAIVDDVQTIWVNAGDDLTEATSTTSVDAATSTVVVSTESMETTTPAPASASSTPLETATPVSSIPLLIVSTSASTPISTSTPPASTTPTPTPTPSPSSSAAAVQSTTTAAALSAGLATSGTSYTGDLTYYETGLGSCGWTSSYNDAIVAVSHVIMDTYNPGNPNNNPLCGREVTITYAGQAYQAKVVDTCEGCAEGDLDLSLGFFSHVTGGAIDLGRIGGVQWSWS